jgi:hypothetical protein
MGLNTSTCIQWGGLDVTDTEYGCICVYTKEA